MPDVIIDKTLYHNPVDYALHKIGGTWRIPILWRLKTKTYRYTELQQAIEKISQKMLTQTLKELEQDEFIERKVYPTVPPKTEYTITAKGLEAIEVITALRNYGLKLMLNKGIDYEELVRQEAATKASNKK